MSTNNIESTAARLNAVVATAGVTDCTNGDTAPGSGSGGNNPNHRALSSGGQIPAPMYNKQSLILSYLTREKDSTGPPRQPGTLECSNKQKDGTNNQKDKHKQQTTYQQD
ncbi:uncharacterized protein MELLADRAFT_101400 [Melampsora larici-populina 98AG31]|uniref:Uncharacterized protein n=1 Tax=Melampsora larici-populina (strain 98AG31 / pathotype 3-4-7) TaxID=747676 RepID=F4R4M0_MELLP|nr:uncharacterized protein MELLADRAFT_101400 [Melampsora larici-populina 98AG31]EGG12975.1 hypothetical protein MELLADRAFT_101400 [Melampsora larici-populina 98AG31]